MTTTKNTYRTSYNQCHGLCNAEKVSNYSDTFLTPNNAPFLKHGEELSRNRSVAIERLPRNSPVNLKKLLRTGELSTGEKLNKRR